MVIGNIFDLSNNKENSEKELFETIFNANNCEVERIVSWGQITPEGQWYDQERDEWVVLLQGKATIEFAEKEILITAGDYILIPARKRHRVTYTSTEPPCIWLAIHGEIDNQHVDK